MDEVQLIFFVGGPALIAVSIIFLKIVGESPKRDIGLDLHLLGFLYLFPIIGSFPGKLALCFSYFLVSVCSLIFNIGFFMLSLKGKPFPRRLESPFSRKWGDFCLYIGLANFLFGLFLSLWHFVF